MAQYKDYEIAFRKEWLTIGKIGGKEYSAYCILTTDHRAAASGIALHISNEEYEQICTAADPLSTAQPIYDRAMRSGMYSPID